MELLHGILVTSYVVIAVIIIVLVLVQHGKGASTGASFGGGASGSLFGAAGSANFLSRTTAVMISLFFIISIALSYLSIHSKSANKNSIVDILQNTKPSSINVLPSNTKSDLTTTPFTVPSN